LGKRFALYSQVCQTGGKTWSKCDGGGLNPLLLKRRSDSILSEYQAEYPAILDMATYLSLKKLFGTLVKKT
jgi:hypothetical protein